VRKRGIGLESAGAHQVAEHGWNAAREREAERGGEGVFGERPGEPRGAQRAGRACGQFALVGESAVGAAGEPVACGAVKLIAPRVGSLKRMWVAAFNADPYADFWFEKRLGRKPRR